MEVEEKNGGPVERYTRYKVDDHFLKIEDHQICLKKLMGVGWCCGNIKKCKAQCWRRLKR